MTAAPPNFRRGILLPSFLLLVAMLNLTLIVTALKELIVDELGGTAAQVGLFFSIEMVAYVLFAPLWGVMSDRWGKRRPLVVVGFLGSAVLYFAYAWVENVTLLLALRFIQGAFTVMGWSLLMAMVMDHPDEARRGRNMGVMGGSLILGVSLGAPIGGYVASHFGVRAPLEMAAVLFFGVTAMAFFLPTEGQVRQHVPLAEIRRTLGREPRLLVPFLFHLTDRYTVGLFIILFPLYLAHLGTEDPAARGRYLAFYLLPFALLQYFTGRLSERTGPFPPLLIGSVLYGAALCTVGFADLFALWPVMGALGVLAAVMFPPSMTLVSRWSTPATRGSAMGGFNLSGSLGFAAGPVVGIAIYERAGFAVAFATAGVLEILVAVVAFVWWRHSRRERDDD